MGGAAIEDPSAWRERSSSLVSAEEDHQIEADGAGILDPLEPKERL